MSHSLISYLIALGSTLIIEAFIILPFFKAHCLNFQKLIINFVLINCITNLSLNILVLFFSADTFSLMLELVIPITEAFMFKYAGVTRSRKSIMIISFIANLLSFVIGILLFQYLAHVFQPQPVFPTGVQR